MDQVFPGELCLFVPIEHPRPLVVRSGYTASERDRHSLEMKTFRKLPGYADISLPDNYLVRAEIVLMDLLLPQRGQMEIWEKYGFLL